MSTELRLSDIRGDKTGWLHVTDQQNVRAAVVEGTIGAFVTTINMEIGEQAVLHVPDTLTVAGVTLDIKGTCTFNNLVVENGGTIQGHLTTFTSSYANGQYTPTSSPGSYTLVSIKLKRGANFLLPAGGLKMTIGTFELKRYVVMEMEFVELVSVNLILEREAALSTSGKASVDDPLVPASAHGEDRNGGAHTAAGGVGSHHSVENASLPFGTIYTPRTPGGSGGQGGLGGGWIYVQTDQLILDGILRSSGADSVDGGGGAGGSIYVVCSFALKGLGSMEAIGGSTMSAAAGAGSGGHIAVNMKNDNYQGSYSAGGGTSPAPHGDAGPGSVYTLSKTNGEKLVCDNANGQTDFYTTLKETDMVLNFDEVDIYNYAQLQLINDGQPRELNILNVNSDGTGLVRIQNNQKGTLERSETDTRANSKLMVNIELHNGGEFIMSETVTILGTGKMALDLDGVLRGVSNLYLGPNRNMTMGSNAKVVSLSATNLDAITYVTFATLQLEPGSWINYAPNTGALIQASNINLKFAAKLHADFFNISASNIDLELESEMSCSSHHRTQSDEMDITLGSGVPGADGDGGAAHGGVGGGWSDLSGSSYNSLYYPIQPGSRGTYDPNTGIKRGGRGAGFVHLRLGNLLINDGTIAANGGNADPLGSRGGAGSGGSVLIELYDFEGYGDISVTGGDGYLSNGGGAAGRVAVHCLQRIQYEGSYTVYGGSGANDTQAAGGGTVYLKDIRASKTYKRLLLNNKGRPHNKYATIDESFNNHYFDEVHLLEQASVHMAADGRNTRLEIYKAYGDGTGLIHLHGNQKLLMEYRPAVRNAFLTGVNFIIDHESEVIFPSITYVYGTGVFLEGQTESRSVAIDGKLTGIADLILGFETLLYFGPNAHTASINQAGGYNSVDPAGTITFGTVDMRSLSEIKYAPDQTVQQQISRMDCRYKSVISAESLTISASIFQLEAGAMLTASAIYRPHDARDEMLGRGVDAQHRGTLPPTTTTTSTTTTTTRAPRIVCRNVTVDENGTIVPDEMLNNNTDPAAATNSNTTAGMMAQNSSSTTTAASVTPPASSRYFIQEICEELPATTPEPENTTTVQPLPFTTTTEPVNVIRSVYFGTGGGYATAGGGKDIACTQFIIKSILMLTIVLNSFW